MLKGSELILDFKTLFRKLNLYDFNLSIQTSQLQHPTSPLGPSLPTGELGQLLHAAWQETEPSAEAKAAKQRRLAAIAESQ